MIKKITISLILLLLVTQLFSQKKDENIPKTRILFIFDASQSMLGEWDSGRKIDIAQKMLSRMVDSLALIDNLEIALRVYGHQYPVPPQRCDDTKLEVPFAKNNAENIKRKLHKLKPKGTTPIAKSLELCANDFPDCPTCRNIVILITDGIEACDGDPCAISIALQRKGIVLKPFIIGVGLNLDLKDIFECVGRYFNADTEDKFETILNVVISQALNSTTAQVNLLDSYGKPSETNVNMTFYDNLSGKIMHNYMHTINHRGNPDTILLDPLTTYNMQVHTIPPVFKDSITLVPGKHNIIALDAPQGYLEIKVKGNMYKDVKTIIRKKNTMNTLHVQNGNTSEKYIIGKYDVEILSLPRLNIENVSIKQNYTTTLEIPKPGIVSLNMETVGYGSLYLEKNSKLEWFYNLSTVKKREKLVLLPGNYRVVYRAKNAKETSYTFEKSFKIVSGASISINLR